MSEVEGISTVVSRRNEICLHPIRPNLRGTVIEGDNITLVRWVIDSAMPKTGLHSHDEHEQFTIVVSGSVETVVGDEALVLHAGDVCRIRPKVVHGGTRSLGDEEAVLIDVFEPTREDYLAAMRKGDSA